MKIVYHHRTLGDGAEGIHVSAITKAFRGLGHDVRVGAVIGDQTNVSTPRTRMYESLSRWTPRPVYEAMELGYSLAGYHMLTGCIENWKPDFLYERYTLFNMAGIGVAWRKGIPLVLEVNAPLAYERAQYERIFMKRLARRCEAFVCSHADLVVVVSTPLKDHLVKEGVSAERIVVLPNGTDPAVFHPDAMARDEVRAHFGIPDDTVVVGFSGILRPWHGIELLLEAVAKITASREPVHALIVGDGPSRIGLEKFVREHGIQGSVTFTGRVPFEAIPRYLAAFDMGVSPRATFYASPMKIPEYMAMGLTVIAPKMPNIEDLITEGKNGMLFTPEDSSDLARVLSSLLHDSARRQQLGEQAQGDIRNYRTWTHNAMQVLDHLKKKQAST